MPSTSGHAVVHFPSPGGETEKNATNHTEANLDMSDMLFCRERKWNCQFLKKQSIFAKRDRFYKSEMPLGYTIEILKGSSIKDTCSIEDGFSNRKKKHPQSPIPL